MRTEQQMRDQESPWPKSKEEFEAYIESLAAQQHDYGTCAHAMSLAATAAFNYIASKLGTTGFQAGAASIDTIRRIKHLKGPFMIVDVSDELCERDRSVTKVKDYIADSRVWLRGEARKKIESGGYFHPDVFHRLMELATFAPSTDDDVKSWNRANPENQITGQDWYDSNREDVHEFAAKLEFLRDMGGYFPAESFVEAHTTELKRFGMSEIHLLGGDVTKCTNVKEGCSCRLSMPTSLEFSRELDGVKISFSVDTEVDGSNGAPALNFDFGLLEAMERQTKPAVAEVITAYIAKARKAVTKGER